ncbi:MAG: ChaN family lipoprotein [Planctomycetota bacterium]
MKHRLAAFAAIPLLALGSCATLDGLGPKVTEVLATPSGNAVTVEEAAAELSKYDVVFLGELHDSVEGHEVMTRLTELLLDGEPAPVLSMEMFERDVQDWATAYVQGRVCREAFLANARPWSTHEEMYAAAVDMARERGWALLAANAPRPAAREVGRHGFRTEDSSIFASNDLDLSDSEYRERFGAAMGEMSGHGSPGMLDSMYAAQVLKDETMAESIARLYAPDGGRWPTVVHWCGRFHSDWGLGTVERLRRRAPFLEIAVVSMERGSDAVDAARSANPPGLFVIRVP